LENEHEEENVAEEIVQLVDFEEGQCEETLENEHVEENVAEEIDVQEVM
jgi:hypothetical protein